MPNDSLSEGRSAGDRVAHALREGMRDGRWVPGQRLIETDLTADLGASRGSVREALDRLRSEGLVTSQPHRGARVSRLSRDDFHEVFSMIEVLEGLAAREAAKNAGRTAELKVVQQAQARYAHAIERGDRETALTANRDLHSGVAALADNRRLTEVLTQLWLPMAIARVWRTLDEKTAGALQLRAAREHDAVISAIAARNPAEAERAMRHHLRSSAERILGLSDAAFR